MYGNSRGGPRSPHNSPFSSPFNSPSSRGYQFRPQYRQSTPRNSFNWQSPNFPGDLRNPDHSWQTPNTSLRSGHSFVESPADFSRHKSNFNPRRSSSASSNYSRNRKQNSHNLSESNIKDYVNPSMLEDPWLELEQNIQKEKSNCENDNKTA